MNSFIDGRRDFSEFSTLTLLGLFDFPSGLDPFRPVNSQFRVTQNVGQVDLTLMVGSFKNRLSRQVLTLKVSYVLLGREESVDRKTNSQHYNGNEHLLCVHLGH